MKIYAAYGAPQLIKGLVRDIRPVWALEELGADYELEWLDTREREQKSEAYLALNPFGKVPAMVDGDVTLFESGAICLYLANKHKALGGPAGSAHWDATVQWSFAALDTVLPPLFDHFIWTKFRADNSASESAAASARELCELRFETLDGVLADRQFLVEAELTVADILMGAAFRYVMAADIIGDRPHLNAYLDRLYARPAFKKAYEINLAGPGAAAA